MKPKPTRLFLYLLAALFILNLLQSHFTELLFDEAYYWYYAQQPAWGYFDHPPMVALLIRIGGLFFDGELGVRFMSCILSVGTLAFIWNTLSTPGKDRYVPHFYCLAFSMTLLNAYGFFTLPDTPLLFFTAVFLWLYKHFLRKEGLPVAIGLGLVMAALMYSKYHAVLVILFVLLSNLRLLRSWYAWLAVAVALLCYIPHLLWLFENDFVSIRYHLFERPNRAYDFNDFTLGYFINLIALFGFTFPWVYKALFKTRATDPFTRSLLFLVYGVLIFFFLSSFQRRVQTQWIIVICIPMLLIVFQYMLEHPGTRKWLVRTAIANGVLLLYLRLGLIYEPLFPILFETHGNREWVSKVEAHAGDLPVVFENSYREAPMYAFYSGNTAFSLNNLYYRRNQYNIDGSEARLQHRKILYISKFLKEGDISYTTAKGRRIYGNYMEDFESYRELECYIEQEGGGPKDNNLFRLKVYNPYGQRIPLEKLRFGVAFLNRYKQVKEVQTIRVTPAENGRSYLEARDTTRFEFRLPLTKMEDPAYLKITISENNLLWGLNGEPIKPVSWNQ